MAESNLAATTAQRKERLALLKKRKAGEDGAAEPANGSSSQAVPFTFKQRNFDLSTRQVLKRPRKLASGSTVLDDVADGEDTAGTVTVDVKPGETVEDAVRGLAERIVKEDEERRREELDLLNIAPKRANWDLKRDMEKRTRKLERQTREAYLVLFRQRLQSLKAKPDTEGTAGTTASSGTDLLAGMRAAEEENRARMRMADVEAEEAEAEDRDAERGEVAME